MQTLSYNEFLDKIYKKVKDVDFSFERNEGKTQAVSLSSPSILVESSYPELKEFEELHKLLDYFSPSLAISNYIKYIHPLIEIHGDVYSDNEKIMSNIWYEINLEKLYNTLIELDYIQKPNMENRI